MGEGGFSFKPSGKDLLLIMDDGAGKKITYHLVNDESVTFAFYDADFPEAKYPHEPVLDCSAVLKKMAVCTVAFGYDSPMLITILFQGGKSKAEYLFAHRVTHDD